MDQEKKVLHADEQKEEERQQWKDNVKNLDFKQFIFLDESGSNIALTRLYARAPKGKRAKGSIPRNRGKNMTVISTLTLDGIGESLIIDGAANTEIFEMYIERILAPSLHPGQIGSDLAQQKGVEAHLDYLRKREALMQYPQFRQQGWPIGSGMVESANKNVVEARLKGPGMHWERGNVNPMLALRNAVCNDRWREMWQKALHHHRKLRALQREAQAEQRARPLLVVDHTPSQEPLSPPQPVSEQMSPPAPAATPPNPSRLSTRHNRHPGCKRVSAPHQRSGEARAELCLCGTPLVHRRGHRTKAYCSDRCRVRAYRMRQRHVRPCSAPVPPLAPAKPRSLRVAKVETKRLRVPSLKSGGVRGETCLFCGMSFSQTPGGRLREYCSGRCRQRAHRERQRRVS